MKLLTMDVVVPAYNEEAGIAECLDCLLAQGDDLRKIIIVDNASTDKTANIVKKYARKHSKIQLVNEAKAGVENARNTGFATAKADIIGRIDVDTRVRSGWAQAVRQFLTDRQDFAGCTGFSEFYDMPFPRYCRFMAKVSRRFVNNQSGSKGAFVGSNMAIRRDAWQEIKDHVKGEESGELMEDLALSLTLHEHGGKIGTVPNMLAGISGRRQRTSPLSYARYSTRWWNTYVIYNRPFKALLIRIFAVWLGNLTVAFWSPILRFYDSKTKKWSFKNWQRGFEGRDFRAS
ncbi:glycosyltransferase family 2 protein [Candidatus Saccharibacteria bacterium]|nr:glycosyltransferase family 2 protein [Candidatus Saccharibacteria bacterium]